MPPTKDPAPKAAKPFADMSLLEPSEQLSIREQAEKQVADEAAEIARKTLLEQEVEAARERRGLKGVKEEICAITIDLPAFAAAIVINGTHYIHGFSYNVPRSLYVDIKSQMQASWRHEQEIGGANREHYRKPLLKKLRGDAVAA